MKTLLFAFKILREMWKLEDKNQPSILEDSDLDFMEIGGYFNEPDKMDSGNM